MNARGWLWLGVAILVAGLGGLVWVRAEGAAPRIEAPASLAVGAAGRDVDIALADEGTGLRRVRASVQHADGEGVLVDETLAGDLLHGGDAVGSIRIHIDPTALGLPDGDAILRIAVNDWSWRGGLGGNASELAIPLAIDRKKPRVEVFTGLTYVYRGGAGAVAYSVSEPSVRDGVAVGDSFFRGYPHPDFPDRRIALYAIPATAPEIPSVRVIAEDAAGNIGTGSWAVVVRDRALPRASVTLPASFLEQTVRSLAGENGIDTSDLTEAFRRINTDMRRANEQRIREVTAQSAQTPLWKGPFEQIANSKVTSRFAEQRSYFVGGEKNSEAIHYGYDLASTAGATITAANAGRVVYAGDLGIYGNCVLIDHGIGLATLYGHLSYIEVSVGDEVARGGPLGRSGQTGLAGGDHLHFAVLVGDTYVDPLEWWDAEWVQKHIDVNFEPSSG